MDHHAYFFEADQLADAALPDEVLVAATDVHHIVVDRFAIGDARELTEQAWRRPVVGEIQSFVIVTVAMTPEAQNALLKLFEEPPTQSRFYLVMPNFMQVLPTLRSRLLATRRAAGTVSGYPEAFTEFSKDTYAGRLAQVAKLTKDQDLETQSSLLTGFEQYVANNIEETKALGAAVVATREALESAGASRKMLLESLALLLPQDARV